MLLEKQYVGFRRLSVTDGLYSSVPSDRSNWYLVMKELGLVFVTTV